MPAVRLVELSGIADSYEHDDIGPVVQGLYAELGEQLYRSGVAITGPAVAYFQPGADGKIDVHAGLSSSVDAGVHEGFDVVDLPAVETAATLVHRGRMKTIGASVQALGRWIEDNGYQPAGPAREYYLVSVPEPEENWVTELLEPIVAADRRPRAAG